ncbi:magnesium transporter [Eggerthia catenaformis OT 569 = DSM 20559]|uniref:Magnesium transporter MgtE n=1 Tax=Eggerthia catenaformis OT 569 = DSM 20559 TaxID=999415 RepID=M2NCZ1_9FIRM|nr:magnesium transporter [Eggerthia catenaformis]EMD16048.1 magnesium transporter [Eggerthia catenaformis OT 569 = DSM 20559]OUC51821.1 magnesium transporter [Eggerthia catenaformis]
MNLEKILELLNSSHLKELHEYLLNYNAVDIAEILSECNDHDLAIIFRVLEKKQAAEVFSYMENEQRTRIINVFNDQEIVKLLNNLYADDAVDFLSEMPSNLVTHLLDRVDSDVRKDINSLLHYEEDTAGSIMTVEFIEFTLEMTVKQALEKIKRVGIDSETVYTCYVVERRKLIGIVSAKSLILSDDNVLIKDLMVSEYIFAYTSDDKEDIAKKLKKYDLIAIPVLDEELCIVGIVTFDDAIDVLTEETTEDMQKMAAIVANDKSYLNTSIWDHAKSRIVWLLILMFSATLTGSIISRYEHAFSVMPLLVSFIPMLMDTGGNCGSQSSTLIIRGLAVDEIEFSDFFKVVFKEFRISIVVGFFLAIANGVRIVIMNRDVGLAIVVSLSIMVTVMISKLVGCILPIAAKRLNFDPAIMAAPIITTVVDTLAIIVYFTIASQLFHL